MKFENGTILNGDCLESLKEVADGCVNLIVTSPPYSDQRKNTYGGVKAEDYVDWFLPIGAEMQRVLADDGSFILNIKEKTEKGEKHIYVMELILALRKQQGWKLIDEYIWHKKNLFPSSRPNGLRDSWERCLHFAKQTDIKIRKNQVSVPAKESTIKRLERLNDNDIYGRKSGTKSGMDTRMVLWRNAEKSVYPTNVLYLSAETVNRGHPAVFPMALPDFFIRLFTDEKDIVLDPFLGSGTTCLVAESRRRRWIGIEQNTEYYRLAKARMEKLTTQKVLI